MKSPYLFLCLRPAETLLSSIQVYSNCERIAFYCSKNAVMEENVEPASRLLTAFPSHITSN